MTHHRQPQDAQLLCARWADPEHFPAGRTVIGWDWRAHYERALEATMARWLATAFLAWQVEQRRPAAFAPVAHLVGVAPGLPDGDAGHANHVNAIARLCRELGAVDDPSYRPPAGRGGPDAGQVRLGACLENAIAPALKLLAQRATAPGNAGAPCLPALHDLLRLVEAVRPLNAAEPLCDAWDFLFGDGQAVFTGDELSALRQRFVLALAPLAHAGLRHERIAQLVAGLALPAESAASEAAIHAAFGMIFGTGTPAGPDDELPAPTAPALPAGFPGGWQRAFAPEARPWAPR